MKTELLARYIAEDEESEPVRHWFIKTGIHWISINEALKEDVIEVDFIDSEQTLLDVTYSNWDSMELGAIVTTLGESVFKGFNSIEFVEVHGFFIVLIDGSYIDSDLFHYYNLQDQEVYFMVIDSDGKVKIEPTKSVIRYFDDEDIFVMATGRGEIIINAKEL